MFYCRKCSRLLEEDLKKCPYCGNEEEEVEQAPENTPVLPKLSDGIDEQLEELNQMIEENKKIEVSSVPNIIPPPPVAPSAIVIEEEISNGIKVLFILLSIFIAPVGIIVGAIYLSRESRTYKSMGKTMLIISVVSLVLSVICCCVLYVAIVSFANSAYGVNVW